MVIFAGIHFLSSGRLFVFGVILAVLSSIWFLVASYACEKRRVRWINLFPTLRVSLMLKKPEGLLAPFVLYHVALLVCFPTLIRILRLLCRWRFG